MFAKHMHRTLSPDKLIRSQNYSSELLTYALAVLQFRLVPSLHPHFLLFPQFLLYMDLTEQPPNTSECTNFLRAANATINFPENSIVLDMVPRVVEEENASEIKEENAPEIKLQHLKQGERAQLEELLNI
ncbi:hypothetical protein X975_03229, partial [Stegodyphus mimosarum]